MVLDMNSVFKKLVLFLEMGGLSGKGDAPENVWNF